MWDIQLSWGSSPLFVKVGAVIAASVAGLDHILIVKIIKITNKWTTKSPIIPPSKVYDSRHLKKMQILYSKKKYENEFYKL